MRFANYFTHLDAVTEKSANHLFQKYLCLWKNLRIFLKFIASNFVNAPEIYLYRHQYWAAYQSNWNNVGRLDWKLQTRWLSLSWDTGQSWQLSD